jgi:hypothetical protein
MCSPSCASGSTARSPTWVAMWALVAELGLIALFAVRKIQLRWWEKLLTVLILASFGAAVLVIKMLAH